MKPIKVYYKTLCKILVLVKLKKVAQELEKRRILRENHQAPQTNLKT